MNRAALLAVPLVALAIRSPSAARQAQPPSFASATRTVAVYATVTNADGRLVPISPATISRSPTTASRRR